MPFVLLTARPEIDKETRSQEQGQIVRTLVSIGGGVLRLFETKFRPSSFSVWSSFPGNGLGGTLDSEGQIVIRSPDLMAAWKPDEGGTGEFRNPLRLASGIKLHHVVEVRGAFRLGDSISVPAVFSLNLSPAWSGSQGDIVFDTFNTADHPNEGFSDLLRNERALAEPFLFSLMHGISKLNKEGAGFKIKSAVVKDTEGREETRRFLTIYRHYETSLRPLLIEAMEERIHADHSAAVLGTGPPDVLATAAYDGVVRDLVREMGETKDFTTALATLQQDFGVSASAVGSVILTSWDPDAVDKMAGFVVEELGGQRIQEALRARMGQVTDWGRDFARIAAGTSKGAKPT